MKVLVIGSGGREHSLIWKLKQSPIVERIFCTPGNAGIENIAKCIDIKANDIKNLALFARDANIDFTVVGPETPLVNGIVDEFESRKLKIFGPCKKAAMIEGNKASTKEFMLRHNIPTGQAQIFTKHHFDQAKKHILNKCNMPIVVKASGLAAGKGVTIAKDKETAISALEDCFKKKKFSYAGNVVLVEEYLQGEEVSVFVLTNGETIIPLPSAQDYKRIFDKDKGPNTGGMGSYSPAPILSKELYKQIMNVIIKPTIKGLKEEGITYKGVLYGGLIITKDGPKVIEYNCRFGDPESQAIFPRLETDLAELMLATVCGNLTEYENKVYWSSDKCICIVAASPGYPEKPETGFEITGLEEAKEVPGVQIFHAGTTIGHKGKLVTAGGRVLNVSAKGNTFKQAIENAYNAIEKINFEGMQHRKDIGERVLTNK